MNVHDVSRIDEETTFSSQISEEYLQITRNEESMALQMPIQVELSVSSSLVF